MSAMISPLRSPSRSEARTRAAWRAAAGVAIAIAALSLHPRPWAGLLAPIVAAGLPVGAWLLLALGWPGARRSRHAGPARRPGGRAALARVAAVWTGSLVLGIGASLAVLHPGAQDAVAETFAVRHADKAAHLVAYAALAYAGARALGHGIGTALRAPGVTTLLRAASLAFVVATGWGGVLEVAQGLVPERMPGGLDLAANAVGAGLGALAWTLARWRAAATPRSLPR